jgi:hypothetical protein
LQVSLLAGGPTTAADGHNELFKMTLKYDGKIGREHRFPRTRESL